MPRSPVIWGKNRCAEKYGTIPDKKKGAKSQLKTQLIGLIYRKVFGWGVCLIYF